jgi:hypothetical protein
MQKKNMHRSLVLILLIQCSIAYVINAAPLLRKTKYYKNAQLMHDCVHCIYLIAYASSTRDSYSLMKFTTLPNYLALPP